MKAKVKLSLLIVLIIAITLTALIAILKLSTTKESERLPTPELTSNKTQVNPDEELELFWTESAGASRYVLHIGYGGETETMTFSADTTSAVIVLRAAGVYELYITAGGATDKYSDSAPSAKLVIQCYARTQALDLSDSQIIFGLKK